MLVENWSVGGGGGGFGVLYVVGEGVVDMVWYDVEWGMDVVSICCKILKFGLWVE